MAYESCGRLGGRKTGKALRHAAKKTKLQVESELLKAGESDRSLLRSRGLTKGLEAAGTDVVMGVDIDPACKYPYAANNKATFVQKSIEDISRKDFAHAFDGAAYTLLAGCAPCQPFSNYRNGKSGPSDKRWHLLNQFVRLIEELDPDLVTMENVPRLAKEAVFSRFVSKLAKRGFHVRYDVVNCADYGVPQHRERLVLLASKLGPIELMPPTTRPAFYKTVNARSPSAPEASCVSS